MELVADKPDHAGRHPVITAGVGKIGDELGDVIPLCRRELPVVLQTEGKSIKSLVASLIDGSLAFL